MTHKSLQNGTLLPSNNIPLLLPFLYQNGVPNCTNLCECNNFALRVADAITLTQRTVSGMLLKATNYDNQETVWSVGIAVHEPDERTD